MGDGDGDGDIGKSDSSVVPKAGGVGGFLCYSCVITGVQIFLHFIFLM